MPFNNSDREHARRGQLSDWLTEFANTELQKDSSPFDDIKNLFQKNDGDAVEARVQEMRERIGLDKIEKMATDEESIFGGFGDNQPDERYDKGQLEKGTKVELEHTDDPEKAKEITKDHLEETKDFKDGDGAKYYDELEDMEEKMEKKLTSKLHLIQHLISVANSLEDEGKIEAAEVIDRMINKLAKKDSIFDKHPNIMRMIDNVCSGRGGHIDAPAVMEMITHEKLKDTKLTESEKDEINKYIKQRIKEEKGETKEEDDLSSMDYTVFVVTEDDGNDDIFSGSTRL
jgi:hypothetical protein